MSLIVLLQISFQGLYNIFIFKLFHLFLCSIVLGSTYLMEQIGTGGTA